MFQIHLCGKGMSGRGVRYKVLTMQEIEAAETGAGHESTKETLLSEYQSKYEKLALEMMVQEITEPVGKNNLPTAKWTPTNPQDLSMSWNRYFGMKDTVMLRTVFRKEHNLTEAEVEEIMLGKLEVVPE